MQSLRPVNEARVIIYVAKSRPQNAIKIEDALRAAFPGDTRSGGITENREGDGFHMIVTVKIKEAAS